MCLFDGPSWDRTSDLPGEADNGTHLDALPAFSSRTVRAPFNAHGSPEAIFQTSCTPSPCIGHYSDHLSTMGTPSPCVFRRLDDPQVPLHTTSVRRFPVRPFAFSSIAMEEVFRKSHNRAS